MKPKKRKKEMDEKKTPEQIIAELNLDEKNFPILNTWNPEHLYKTLKGLAKASGCDLATAAVNLELDLSMM